MSNLAIFRNLHRKDVRKDKIVFEYSATRTKTYTIDGKQKYTFKFPSNEIPNPRCLFYIHGQKYICEKITATFKDGIGMSNLLKGVFFRIANSNN